MIKRGTMNTDVFQLVQQRKTERPNDKNGTQPFFKGRRTFMNTCGPTQRTVFSDEAPNYSPVIERNRRAPATDCPSMTRQPFILIPSCLFKRITRRSLSLSPSSPADITACTHSLCIIIAPAMSTKHSSPLEVISVFSFLCFAVFSFSLTCPFLKMRFDPYLLDIFSLLNPHFLHTHTNLLENHTETNS